MAVGCEEEGRFQKGDGGACPHGWVCAPTGHHRGPRAARVVSGADRVAVGLGAVRAEGAAVTTAGKRRAGSGPWAEPRGTPTSWGPCRRRSLAGAEERGQKDPR